MIVNGDGYEVLVDDEDRWLIDNYKWYVDKRKTTTYFKRFVKKNGKTKTEYLHRVVAGNPIGKEIDHINCNTLDNRKQNIRVCTRAQNACNRRPYSGTSKYKGVYYNKKSERWQCQISVDGNMMYLGRFNTEDEAGIMYNIAAMKYYKDYARLNNPRLI